MVEIIDLPETQGQKVPLEDIENDSLKVIVGFMDRVRREIVLSQSANCNVINVHDRMRMHSYMDKLKDYAEIFGPIDPERDYESENKYLRRRLRKLEKRLK